MSYEVLKKTRKEIGNYGEGLARFELVRRGYRLLEHNFYSRHGELDIICEKDEQIVFVEVKTRTSLACGRGVEAVDAQKIQHMMHVAEVYMLKHKLKKMMSLMVVDILLGSDYQLKKIDIYPIA